MKIFTWHIHGSYLYYLSQGDYTIYIPVKQEHTEGYYGRGETFPFGANVVEIAAEEVKNQQFDCILFQTKQNYLTDQYEILSEAQQQLPRIFLQHDPPWQHPTEAQHVVDDPDVTLVHVTHFNRLMWNNNGLHARVIEHGVTKPKVNYSGHLSKGIVVINNLPARGRMLGFDIFQEVRNQVPLDLVGMGTGTYGLGEVLHPQLPEFQSRYRFFFNPIRYTSLGLAICEAMMMGIPVVGLATTELAAVIDNGYSGFIHTNINYLVDKMQMLIKEPGLAREIGTNGRDIAMERFNINRFTSDWKNLFEEVTSKNSISINKSTYEVSN
ncbi:MAG: glycosyltransferase family 1 protein [Sphingobacteriaceae bacterium]|nr:MAG: glycosyltransferase family 1 protein [Sphingobacteriaceae bacterium]